MNKWFTIAKGKQDKSGEITIFGDIGFGYNAADFDRELKALGQIDTLDLRIDTHGGDVFTGNAIYNMLKRTKATVRVTVEGLAASMGSVIAMAGDERIMPENTMMMIHNPMGGIQGGADEIKSFAEMLTNLESGIVKAYVDATNLSETVIRGMMDKETWLTAARAVELGFATKIEKPIKVAASAYGLGRFKNVPKDFGTPTDEVDMKDEDIKRMCALAGKPELAEGLITAKANAEGVMKALETAKSKDDETARATAAAVAEAAAKAKTEGKTVDADAIRAQVIAEHAEITALCDLAGTPEKANEFITARTSVKEVVAKLALAKKAKADAEAAAGAGKGKNKNAGGEVSAHHNPRKEAEGAKSIDTVAIFDKFNKTKGKAA